MNLEVVELEVKPDANEHDASVKTFDLLRPLCLTSYDVDRLCILGGSRQFLLNLNNRFLRLFNNTYGSNTIFSGCRCVKKNAELTNAGTEFQDANAAISDNWIVSHLPYTPELLHKVFLTSGHSILCLLSPIQDNLALTAIAELDPNNVLEYATNYQMWATNTCWPPKMFHKANNRAKKFFHMSQIPLAVLCWMNEFINKLGSTEPTKAHVDQDDSNDQDEIVEVNAQNAPLKPPLEDKPYKRSLVACLDCASTVRNGPPAWIYLIKETDQKVLLRS